jgi:hypothetical protein
MASFQQKMSTPFLSTREHEKSHAPNIWKPFRGTTDNEDASSEAGGDDHSAGGSDKQGDSSAETESIPNPAERALLEELEALATVMLRRTHF